MKREGISLSLNYVVIGVIILAAAALILLNFSGNVGDFQNVVGGQMDSSEKSLAESACLRQMSTICEREGYDDNSWAEDAQYEGMSCADLQESQEIFGSGGDDAIPECEG